MTGKHETSKRKPLAPLHADSWIWLVATVIALSAIANAIG